MITQKDIYEAINRCIAQAFPGHTVYDNENPKDFKRPSFMIEYVRTSWNDTNSRTIEKTSYFTITCFTPVDQYGRSNVHELVKLQEDTLQLFAKGYITVGDRAIKVRGSTGGADLDRAYIDLQFHYYDDRTDDEDTTPLMGSIMTNLQEG